VDTGRLVSEDPLIANRLGMQTQSTSGDLRNHLAPAGAEFPDAVQNAHKPGDLRSIVASRFMRMLRTHDRVRSEMLTAAMK
jgi:hypothetical protein